MASPYNQQPPTWGQVPQAAAVSMPMNYTVARPPAKEMYPKRWITVPILQLIFAIMAAGFAAYLISDRVVIAPIIVICAAGCSIGVSLWLICAHSCAPQSLKAVAALPLEVLLAVLWIAAMAYMADTAAALSLFDWSRFDYLMIYYQVYQATAGIAGINVVLCFVGVIGDSIAVHRERRLRHGANFPPQNPNMQPYMQTLPTQPGYGHNQFDVSANHKSDFPVNSPVNHQPMQHPTQVIGAHHQHELDPQTRRAGELAGHATPGPEGQPSKHELDPQGVQVRELGTHGPTPELPETASPFVYRGGVNQSPVELPSRTHP